MANALIIEKDAAIRNALATRFANELLTESVSSIDRAKERLYAQKFDLIIYDADFVPSERVRTLRLFEKLTRKHPSTNVFIVSASEEFRNPGTGWKDFQWI